MKTCERPGCEKPAVVRFCSSACAIQCIGRDRIAQEKSTTTRRLRALKRHEEETATPELRERIYKMGYMRAMRAYSIMRTLQRLRRAVAAAVSSASGSRTPDARPGRTPQAD
jgi:hypothetical protein